MKKLIIRFKSLNHKNPPEKMWHTKEVEMGDNTGEIMSVELVEEIIDAHERLQKVL